jgi:hypothetical protein
VSRPTPILFPGVPGALCLLLLTCVSGVSSAGEEAAEEEIEPESEPLGRIIVAAEITTIPTTAAVQKRLVRDLEDIELPVIVDTLPLESLPESRGDWYALAAGEARRVPGVIGVFGYDCGSDRCELTSVEPRNRTLAVTPIEPEDRDEDLAYAVAATIREVVLGPLLAELVRIAGEGENPGPPPLQRGGRWLQPPLETERSREVGPRRSMLWLDTGYLGEYAHPGGNPIHGPWLGIGFEPRSMVGLHLGVGWLGMREENADVGSASSHRLVTSLAVRLLLPLGPAHVSLAPVGRLDVTFLSTDPVLGVNRSDTDLEIQVGGISTWHLPLTRRLELLVGAGLLATVLAENTAVPTAGGTDATLIEASTVRIVWSFGVAWGPLGASSEDER